MISQIFVVRPHPSQLQQSVWEFWFNASSGALVLDLYKEERRVTRRHKFAWYRHYSRLDRRNSDMAVHDVPFPEDVQAEALEQFTNQITVVRMP